jgi:Protein of unknown function (DUF4231)
MPVDVTMARLEDQITWYGDRGARNQRHYKILKIVVIVLAATIPVLSGVPDVPKWVLGVLGALIAVIEGIQQVYQFHANWIAYRATCEGLKREKFLYLAKAGPYTAAESDALLAERIEVLISQENTKWVSSQETGEKGAGKQPDASTPQPEASTNQPAPSA